MCNIFSKKILHAYNSFLKSKFYTMKLVLVVRDDLKMGKGKIASQCCHATLLAYRDQINSPLIKKWEQTGEAKVVLKAHDEDFWNVEKEAKLMDLKVYRVQDAGFTQIKHGATTVIAIGPNCSEKIDKVTSKLKLL